MRISSPESIRFPVGKKREGVLTLVVEGAHAPMMQHVTPAIQERVNQFFGYEAVARIAIRQGLVQVEKRKSRLAPPSLRPPLLADQGLVAALQWMAARFERRTGKSPYKLLEHLRFRAGYDFLLLRCESGEIDMDIEYYPSEDPIEAMSLIAAAVVTEASQKMSDPNYSAVMVGGFVQWRGSPVGWLPPGAAPNYGRPARSTARSNRRRFSDRLRNAAGGKCFSSLK